MKLFIVAASLLINLMLSVQVYALPASVKLDMLKTKLVEQLKGNDYSAALQTMQELKQSGMTLPASFEYFEGKALFETGKKDASYNKFSHYAETQGKTGKYYRETIAYLVKIESEKLSKTYWKKSFNLGDRTFLYSIIQVDDGGYMLTGNSNYGYQSGKTWVIKLDEFGNKAWDFSKKNNTYKTYHLYTTLQLSDGQYIAAGEEGDSSDSDAWLVKLSPRGHVEWKKELKGSDDDHWGDIIYSMIRKTDGNIVACGESDMNSWLVAFDKQGKRLWDKNYDSDYYSSLGSIVETNDGGYVLAGFRKPRGGDDNERDARIIKTDALGNVIWARTFGGDKYDDAVAIAKTDDGGFIIAGTSKSIGPHESDIWVFKLDENGQLVWQKAFGDRRGYGAAIIQTADGYFVVAGTTYPEEKVRIFKIKSTGELIWERTLGEIGHGVNGASQTKDGGLVIAGRDKSTNNLWVIKLDKDGQFKR